MSAFTGNDSLQWVGTAYWLPGATSIRAGEFDPKSSSVGYTFNTGRQFKLPMVRKDDCNVADTACSGFRRDRR